MAPKPPNKTARPSRKARLTAARMAAVQALYAYTNAGTPVGDYLDDYAGKSQDGVELVKPELELFTKICYGAIAAFKDLDVVIDAAIPADNPARVEKLLRLILQAGLWELGMPGGADSGIIINDYVNVAHAFYDGHEPKLINAILDKAAKASSPA